MPVLGIASLSPWKRHLTLVFYLALCVVWKTAQVSVSHRHVPEKKKLKNQTKKEAKPTKQKKKQKNMLFGCLLCQLFLEAFKTKINS